MHEELDPASYGLTIWDLDREYLTGGLGRPQAGHARRHPRHPARRLLPHDRRRVHAHPGARREALDPVPGRGHRTDASTADEQLHILDRLNAAEALEKFLVHPLHRPEALRHRGRRVDDPAPRRHPGRSRRCLPRLGRAGHGPPRPAERAGQHRRQVLRAAVPGVRGLRLPRRRAGLRRRQVPPRADGQVRVAGRQRDRDQPRRQPLAPRDRRPGRGRHGPGPHGRDPARPGADPLPGAARAGPRRRRLRRPGRRGRDAQPVQHPRLPRRRHGPRRHQQPGRLHDVARGRPQLLLPHRRGEDGPGADLPRERRRPRGLRAGGAPRLRLPAAVQQGRRHRHGVLPPLRPQRDRRPELHPARHVPPHRRAPLGAQALRGEPGQAGRHHARGGRARARRLPGEAAARPRRDPPGRPRRAGRGLQAEAGRACCPTSPPACPSSRSSGCTRR